MKRGFTLIEMSVVLIVIAIVTHLAMRQLGSVRDQKLVSAANRQLQEVRDSVFSIDREGTPVGFLADMGRLVSVTNGTLSELWQMPRGVRQYAVLPAVKENFVPMSETALKELTNAAVRVATGWRGPYLRLPIGKRRLYDPWGNAMENPDAAGYDRISARNGYAEKVSHFGPTALTNDVHRETVSLVPELGATSRLLVKVVSGGKTTIDKVDYKWYGPLDGLITGGYTNDISKGVEAEFSGLTPGMRVVWESVTRTSRLVRILPGDNHLQIIVP